MTATIHRLYRDMPQELCAAEAREAIAYHLSEMRIQAAHDSLIEVQEMRAEWSANRKAQQAAGVGVSAPLAANSWTIRHAIGIAALLAVFVWSVWAGVR
jgi:hypothetical protein